MRELCSKDLLAEANFSSFLAQIHLRLGRPVNAKKLWPSRSKFYERTTSMLPRSNTSRISTRLYTLSRIA